MVACGEPGYTEAQEFAALWAASLERDLTSCKKEGSLEAVAGSEPGLKHWNGQVWG